MGRAWRNWAGDQACTPAVLERPASRTEVAAAVDRAANAGRVVRVAGAGHSFTDAALTSGTLLSLDRLDRVLNVDVESGLVRVEAGITLHALSAALHAHGLALPNLGDVDAQSVAGATATGTHGTGAKLPNLSAGLCSIELTLADGSTLEVDNRTDPEAWRAAQVSVGTLGVITAVTLQAVPAFTLEAVERPLPLADVLDRIDEFVDGNDHFEFFTFPHSRLAMTRANNRVDRLPRPRPAPREWAEDVLLRNHAFTAVCTLGRARPALIPTLNRLASKVGGSAHLVDRSDRVFSTPRLTRFTEMEYAIPREHAVAAVRAVREVAERDEFAVPFPLEVRWVAPDDVFLSPATGRDACYIAVHMFRGMSWEPYFRAVEQVMDGFDGRPHWGKRHFQTAATLRSRYPEWDRFTAVRRRLDPAGRFANGYVDRVLGPV